MSDATCELHIELIGFPFLVDSWRAIKGGVDIVMLDTASSLLAIAVFVLIEAALVIEANFLTI